MSNEVGPLLRQLCDKLMSPVPTPDQAASWVGEPVEKETRYWTLKPKSAAVDTAWLRFENLAIGDGVPTTLDVHFREPWKTNRAELERLFGADAAWLEHVVTRRTLCFEVKGDGDAKGTVCVRVDLPGADDAPEWTVRSALIRRIHGPRRA